MGFSPGLNYAQADLFVGDIHKKFDVKYLASSLPTFSLKSSNISRSKSTSMRASSYSFSTSNKPIKFKY